MGKKKSKKSSAQKKDASSDQKQPEKPSAESEGARGGNKQPETPPAEPKEAGGGNNEPERSSAESKGAWGTRPPQPNVPSAELKGAWAVRTQSATPLAEPKGAWGPKLPQPNVSSAEPKGAWGARPPQPNVSSAEPKGAWGATTQSATPPAEPTGAWGARTQSATPPAEPKGAWGPRPPQSNVSSAEPKGAWGARTQSATPAAEPKGAWGPRPPQSTVSSAEPKGAWGARTQSATPPAESKGAWGPKPPQPNVSSAEPKGAWGARTQSATPSAEQAVKPQLSEEQMKISPAEPVEADGTRTKRPPPSNEIKTRPMQITSKQGTSGTPVLLEANYFKILSKTDWCLYQYRVDIAPEETRTFVRKAILRNHKDLFGAYLFDGTMLFTSNRLPKDQMEIQSGEDNTPIKITLRLVGDLAIGDHHYLQLFNILVRRCLEHLQLQLVGRNFFDAAARNEIREYGLELWPGYVTSIRQHESGIMMCTEIAHKVMRERTLLDILREIYSKSGRESYQTAFVQTVLGSIVLTAYNNRTYKIDDIDFNSNPETTFVRNRENITFAQYYREKYQIIIKDLKQPLLVSRAKARERRAGNDELIYLIPELCRATGLTDNMRNDFRLMKALARHTKLPPATRMDQLLNFKDRLLSKPNVVAEFNEWNFKLDSNLIRLKGRVLPGQKIAFAGGTSIVPQKVDWNFAMQEKPFLRAIKLVNWIAVVPARAEADLQNFLRAMIAAARKMSFVIPPPQIMKIPNDSVDTYVKALETVTSTTNAQLIMCVVTSNQSQRYAAIKKKLCIDRPVPSQVVLCKTLGQKTPSMTNAVSGKIAIQINCKLGGIPWGTDVSSIALGVMAVGFDVCHTKEGSDFGAMVASLDEYHGRYFSAVSKHASGEELSNDLALHLSRACQAFRQERNHLPKMIVIYRDGVGEGQIPFVHDYEVMQIKTRLQQVYGPNIKFKLAVIIVTKRINTRIFHNRNNPAPGTVVDDVITDPLKYDFFLVSQNVREGTVAPTSYNVIEDNTGLSPDKMQMMTYKFCHLYYNFTGGIRVPAPCQYAHKLAFFVSQSVKQIPNTRLERQLYFI